MKRIIVNNIWKKFTIGTKKKQSVLEKFISLFSGREPRRIIWALKNVSFIAESGEIIGLIGKNGSGKSTLLRIIAGIYHQDKGAIFTKGKIVSLIGLETGLNHRATVKDNIYLCCSILGLKQEEIKRKFKDIVSFAELEDFVDTKLYQFSSGMITRLAFSIVVHSLEHKKPEILLLDEILAVGDGHYRNKCTKKIKELVKGGGTVIITSHQVDLIRENCERIIWIENGIIKKDGKKDVLYEYLRTTLD